MCGLWCAALVRVPNVDAYKLVVSTAIQGSAAWFGYSGVCVCVCVCVCVFHVHARARVGRLWYAALVYVARVDAYGVVSSWCEGRRWWARAGWSRKRGEYGGG